jgi:hypothetical protein
MSKKQRTIFDDDMAALQATLTRLENRRNSGRSAADTIPVDVYLLQDLLDEIRELRSWKGGESNAYSFHTAGETHPYNRGT